MIKIYGHSDDVVVIGGNYTGETKSGHKILIGTLECGLFVSMQYAPSKSGPVWRASIEQINEDILLPWPVTIVNAEPSGYPLSTYSVMVIVDCPIDTPVKSKNTKITECQ